MPTSSKSFRAQLKKKYKSFLSRRPHRTLRLTRRRDYIRPLELPGHLAFTYEVNSTLWRHRKLFALVLVVYTVLYGILVGIQSQATFTELTQTLTQTGEEVTGNWGALDQAGAVLLSIVTAGTSTEISESQMIFSVLVILMVWLVSVWLLRNLMAGHKVKLRDGIYNSGAPIFSTLLITLLIAIQLLPVGLAVIGYNAALTSGVLDGGATAMLFWIAASLLGVLSLYWITSSLFAMIIVTIPGMYPYQAVKTAGDLVLGRRVKILLRWLWMALVIAVTWVLVLLPFIFLDMGLKNLWPAIEWLPILPIVILILSAFSIVWISTYVYLLYRKVVDYAPKS